MSATSLTDLANLYGSDKGTIGPSSEWGAHNYTDIYEAYVAADRYSPVSILEIGLGVVGDRWDARIVHGRNAGGASLKMWYDYFPSGRIFGVDVNACAYLDNDRITTFVADQGNLSDLEAFDNATRGIVFDVIIDDGSHRPDHQQVSLGFLFKRLKRGGLYFIEDLVPNGRGDGATGRHACDDVINTRSVLKAFVDRRQFPEPHAIVDPEYLAANIAHLTFHVPVISVDPAVKEGPAPAKSSIRYAPNSELLCAIRKR